MDGAMVWLAVEKAAITYEVACDGIRMPIFSQTASIGMFA